MSYAKTSVPEHKIASPVDEVPEKTNYAPDKANPSTSQSYAPIPRKSSTKSVVLKDTSPARGSMSTRHSGYWPLSPVQRNSFISPSIVLSPTLNKTVFKTQATQTENITSSPVAQPSVSIKQNDMRNSTVLVQSPAEKSVKKTKKSSPKLPSSPSRSGTLAGVAPLSPSSFVNESISISVRKSKIVTSSPDASRHSSASKSSKTRKSSKSSEVISSTYDNYDKKDSNESNFIQDNMINDNNTSNDFNYDNHHVHDYSKNLKISSSGKAERTDMQSSVMIASEVTASRKSRKSRKSMPEVEVQDNMTKISSTLIEDIAAEEPKSSRKSRKSSLKDIKPSHVSLNSSPSKPSKGNEIEVEEGLVNREVEIRDHSPTSPSSALERLPIRNFGSLEWARELRAHVPIPINNLEVGRVNRPYALFSVDSSTAKPGWSARGHNQTTVHLSKKDPTTPLPDEELAKSPSSYMGASKTSRLSVNVREAGALTACPFRIPRLIRQAGVTRIGVAPDAPCLYPSAVHTANDESSSMTDLPKLGCLNGPVNGVPERTHSSVASRQKIAFSCENVCLIRGVGESVKDSRWQMSITIAGSGTTTPGMWIHIPTSDMMTSTESGLACLEDGFTVYIQDKIPTVAQTEEITVANLHTTMLRRSAEEVMKLNSDFTPSLSPSRTKLLPSPVIGEINQGNQLSKVVPASTASEKITSVKKTDDNKLTLSMADQQREIIQRTLAKEAEHIRKQEEELRVERQRIQLREEELLKDLYEQESVKGDLGRR
eukprot:GDKJ01005730.1.p1 GENE.GDKJ01005730.1~~GDKJ01005730.1.p1  ORF type:complete len:902 (-),score=212.30 GDKJ01005730.1:48-2357(-)